MPKPCPLHAIALMLALLCLGCLSLTACKVLRQNAQQDSTLAGAPSAERRIAHATDGDAFSQSSPAGSPRTQEKQNSEDDAGKEPSSAANESAKAAPAGVEKPLEGKNDGKDEARAAPAAEAPQPATGQTAPAPQKREAQSPTPGAEGAVPPPHQAEKKDAATPLQEPRNAPQNVQTPASATPGDDSAADASALNQAQIIEPEQRAAFISLLKKKLNRNKSLFVPPLEEEERTALGPYAEQYDFLRALAENETLLKKFASAEEFEAMLVGDAGNKENYGKVLAESRRVRQMQTDLANCYRKAVREKEELKLPFKVRPVFDEAFNKKILAPLAQLLKIAPYVEEELRHLARVSLAYASEPHNPEKAALLKEFLRRYNEVAEDGNATIREIMGEE